MYCREGETRWTEEDGAWMWGLRDACTLHGLRCGAYITLTPDGWQVLGEDRGGRRPNAVQRSAPREAAGTAGMSGIPSQRPHTRDTADDRLHRATAHR
jgi:hypothetical protein